MINYQENTEALPTYVRARIILLHYLPPSPKPVDALTKSTDCKFCNWRTDWNTRPIFLSKEILVYRLS